MTRAHHGAHCFVDRRDLANGGCHRIEREEGDVVLRL
jgi:hypothetical protein